MFLKKNTKVKIYLTNKTFLQGKIDSIRPDYIRVIKDDGFKSVVLNPLQNVFLIDELDEDQKVFDIIKPVEQEQTKDLRVFEEIQPHPYVKDPELRVKKISELHIERKKLEIQNAKKLLQPDCMVTTPQVNYGLPGFFRKQ